jgi:protein-disulfide isomerase
MNFPEKTMSLLRLLTALGLVAGVLTASPVAAEGQPDRAAIEAIIKDYLVKNPEVIEQAIEELQARKAAAEADRQKKAVVANRDKILDSPQNVVLGNPKGNVTLVEFFDYNCGFCKRGLADLLNLLDTDKDLKVVLKDYPILSPGSIEAATVALAVKEQLAAEQFLEFHKTLMLTRGPVGKDRALEVAKASGADMTKLEVAMARPALRASLAENLRLGDTLGISGTPSYVLGEDLVSGAVGYDTLKAKVDALRKCGQTTC